MPAAAEPVEGCMTDFQPTESVHQQVVMLEAVGEERLGVAVVAHE